MKKRFYLAAACAFLAQPVMADTREDVLAAMQRCSVMQDDRTWLECTYGAQQLMRAKLGLQPAPDYQQRLVPPASAASVRAPVASMPPPSPAAAAPATRASVASAPPTRRRGSFLQILGGTAPAVAVSPLASVQYDSQGAFTVILQNGQVWRQTDIADGGKARFRVGEKVTIVPGALWSYNLKTDDNPHPFKVERRS